MKNMKKLLAIGIAGIFLGTIFGTYIPTERAEPVRPEIPLDRDFIAEVAHALANVANKETNWMGRAFGSSGEQEAKSILVTKWEDNMGEYPLEQEQIKFDQNNGGWVNDKFDITEKNYQLKVGNEIKDQEDYQPIPCLIKKFHNIVGDYTVLLPPDRWYINLFKIGQSLLDEQLTAQQMLYEFQYTSLNNACGITGEVTYIENYKTASIEDTEGRIHLVEIGQNATDDVFYDMINNVCEYNGTGYIVMTTNPTFINKINTAIPGVAISRSDGEKLKEIIRDNDEIIVETEGNSPGQEGTLKVYCHKEDPGCLNKYIYLIDANKCVDHNWDLRGPNALVDWMTLCSWIPGFYPAADAFFWSDLNDDTHVMSLAAGLKTQDFRNLPSTSDNELKVYNLRPIISISGSLKDDLIEHHIQDTVHIIMNSGYINATSYNLVGTIPGDPNSPNCDKQIFIGGHYDSYWGQCPMDNGFSAPIAWGIAKYFHDNGIVPQYTLKLVAWGGEEFGCRGSYFYVHQHLSEKNNFYAEINIDTLGQNSDVPLTPYIYPGRANRWSDSPQSYKDILSVMDHDKYWQVTKHPFYLPTDPSSWENRRDGFMSEIGSDALAFGPLDGKGDPLVKYMVHIERWAYKYDFPDKHNPSRPYFEDFLKFWDHRTGDDFQTGDTWTKVDLTDVSCIANMVLNLTKYFGVDSETIFSDGCSYVQEDLDGNAKYDSVKITFSATTDISSWCNVESRIYQNNLPCSGVFKTDRIGLSQGENTTSNLTITLPSNATAGYYDIRVFLKDDMGNQDDFENTTIYLYPFNNSIANFNWECNGNNGKMINFTDQSIPAPNATFVNWNWSFGNGDYSDTQNCFHNYPNVGTYNVTLVVTDDANKIANITIPVKTFNTPPVASFTESSRFVVVNTTVNFESQSSDVDGNIVNTTWYLGDNTTLYGESVEHSFSKSGYYTVALTVIDNDNESVFTMKSEDILVVDAMVDDNFIDNASAHEWNTIAKGLNNVTNGNIVYVFNGSYNPFEINKSVTLYGESRDNVRISGGNPGVKIRYHNVTLSGFNISSGTNGIDVYVKYGTNQTSNVAIENCNIFSDNNIGILLNQSKGCTIENCSIKESNIGMKIINATSNEIVRCTIYHCTYGVYAFNSSYNFIGSPSITSPYPTDCLFTLCRDSIYLKDSDHNFILGCDIDGTPCTSGTNTPTKGIYLNDSENNTVSTCAIHDTTGKGMYLNDSTWNKIEHCKITWNPTGVCFRNSPENLIAQNHFGGNAEFAVYLPSNIQSNRIYYNDFFANGDDTTNQSWDANGLRGAENSWNKTGDRTLTKTGPGEGNCWSDYTGNDNNHDGIGDTPYLIESGLVERNDSYPVMEPYGWCNFTPDSTLPVIANVTATPHTVGFGFNVTINATVTDNVSNISLVKVNIVYPDHSTGNYTMNSIGASKYQDKFAGTWTAGQYNYTVWAMDETYNTNSSSGHHFHVSAQATISIATLKDSYGASQYINITDPPNPLENLTVVGRGLTWNTYYNASSGCNILESYLGPVNYQADNGSWTPINDSLSQLASNHPAYNYGYRVGNDRGLFGAFFKPNAQNDWPIAFAFNRSDNPTTFVIRSKLVGVGYVDPLSGWAYQYLQSVQSSQGQFIGNTATYQNVFTGTDVTWGYGNTGLKEALTMSNATKTLLQNHPPSSYGLHDASSYLVFITKLDHQNLDMYNASGMLNGNVTISDRGVDFKDALGQFKCALPLGEAYELNNESVREKLTYRIVHLNGNTYLLSGLKVSDLNAMAFPVVIDPTLTVYSTSSDGYISNSGTNYNTVRTASSGTINNSGAFITIGQKKVQTIPSPTYYIYRGFVFFNTTSLPSNAYLDSATFSLYKKDDYSTTDFDITVQNGQPVFPHSPMQSGDYNKNFYSGNGGTYNTSGFHSGYNNMSLTNLAWVTKGGTTKLCLRSSRDINGNTATGNEYVNVYTNEQGSGYQPKLVVVYRNQSKIKNTGSTAIKGYLLIQIQYYNTGQGKWLVEKDTINETSPRTINAVSQLALDTIFNGHVRTNDLHHNTSNYRVYAAFRDPEQNILKTNDGKELVAWWQFTVNAGT